MKKDLILPSELPENFVFTDPAGLSSAQAEAARQQGAGNRMTDPDRKSLPRILRDHLFTLFNGLNFALALCLLLVGSYRNMLFIFVVVANILIGAVQEYRARKTIAALKLLNAPSVHVLRDGQEITVSAEDVVKGDLVILRGGDQVVADAVVVDGSGAAMESLLTGESNAIPKQVNSWLYSGSYIAEGRLTAQLVYVGDESYAGLLTAEARKEARPASRLITDLRRLIRFDSMVLVPADQRGHGRGRGEARQPQHTGTGAVRHRDPGPGGRPVPGQNRDADHRHHGTGIRRRPGTHPGGDGAWPGPDAGRF